MAQVKGLVAMIAISALCCAEAASAVHGPAQQQQQPPQQQEFLRRGLQASAGPAHACILCWMLALAVLAGLASALLHFWRHKQAEKSNETSTPLSATAASANPFAPTNDTTLDAELGAALGTGLSAKGRFGKPAQSETSEKSETS